MVRRIDNPSDPQQGTRSHGPDLPKSWEGFLVKASVKDFRWHDLRHTFASRLVMAGVDLYTVSKLSGAPRYQDDPEICPPIAITFTKPSSRLIKIGIEATPEPTLSWVKKKQEVGLSSLECGSGGET